MLNDLEDTQKYLSLAWTEFLEFICRVSMSYYDENRKELRLPPMEIEDKVLYILERLWEIKMKKIKKSKKAIQKGAKSKKAKAKEFPELVPVCEDSDSD